ncbi:Gfo/Idh/MocA family protein [Limnohabitans sp. 2KL-27]|uniref:Gfo/Idh/MocA family protein n=1 Tax=Limnohabitans sp. 2KL-27 TaxID=1100705 RepID=UPI000A7D13F0|nr:Gfo/Idh/MocA family oxidoreductase [Limnohabitans sp. 2KL-27]
MTPRLGMALVGLGAATQPHLRSLQDLSERIDLRYAVTRHPHPDRVRPYTGPVRLVSELDVVLSDPQVQAVIVATPPSTHLDICQRCFAADKHVLLEKPLELNLERSQQLVALARQSGLHLGVVLQHRFREASLVLQDVLDTGRLGEIQAASVRVPWWRSQAYYNELGRGTLARDGGGVLLTQAIHTLNLFQALVGVKSVTASVVRQTRLHQMETEDHVSALLVLGNGAPGDLMATTAMVPGFPETIEIIGTLGSARLTGADLQVNFLQGESLTVRSEEGTGSGANMMDFSHEPHRDLITDFINAIAHKRAPRVTGEDALKTHMLIDELLRKGQMASD